MEFLQFLKWAIWEFTVNEVASSVLIPCALRGRMYRLFGIKTAANEIRARCTFRGSNVKIGRGSFINYSCVFEDGVEIGDNCYIAFDVVCCTSTHELGPAGCRAGESVSRPIKIGNGCWIGARSVILPGVSIGDGCVVAAGAVVAKDCAPNGLYAGVPARRIKDLP